MRITILTYGTRGDVQPYVALGVGLQRAGFRVRLAAPEPFKAFVTGQELDFAPLAGDITELSRGLVDEAGHNLLRTIPVLMEYILPLALQVLAGVEDACRDADAIIYTFLLAVPGHENARERGVPDFFAQVYPLFVPTAGYPALMFPRLPPTDPRLTGAYNRLTHAIFTGVYWGFGRLSYNWLRRSHPELTPLSGWPFAVQDRPPPPALFGFSPLVVPPPADWSSDEGRQRVHVTGYWHLPPADDWVPPPDLLAFLEDGPPPVYVGFGSMITRDAAQITAVILEALAKAGQRGVLLGGWGDFGGADLPASVFRIDSAPHEWLFPRMTAVVHHGGAGTTAVGLRAGVPSILLPLTADQPFWGQRVVALGVGPDPIPRGRLTAEKLAYAIRVAVTHEPMRRRAAAVGAQIRAEDGVGEAVRIIQRALEG